MSKQSSSSKESDSDGPGKKSVKEIRQIAAEFASWVRRFYERRQWEISALIAVVVFLIQTVFQDQLEQMLPAAFSAVANFFISQTGIAVLGFIIIALQAVELRWINSVGARIENHMERNDQSHPVSTDGGKDTPPRDSKGRFKSGDSGPSIIFVLAVVAVGFLIGSQYGDAQAIMGALIAFLLLSLTDNI